MSTSLSQVVPELIESARAAERGLATAMGASSGPLRQVVAALRADALLPDHENPGDATLQCLEGEVELATTSGSSSVVLTQGDLVVIPHERHYLRAVTDTAVIITQRRDVH
ncbi:hypothetical protein [Blastococcus sp. Marseille-P5729]|uniref:hypothetical protein n=1 Tax=Blastococcus sp. Marseille-P5729 TaxID=2086582 RepID=UPI000D0F528D|nr:hypothetical protein [Blastococcus sp. Marseille-P5729]